VSPAETTVYVAAGAQKAVVFTIKHDFGSLGPGTFTVDAYVLNTGYTKLDSKNIGKYTIPYRVSSLVASSTKAPLYHSSVSESTVKGFVALYHYTLSDTIALYATFISVSDDVYGAEPVALTYSVTYATYRTVLYWTIWYWASDEHVRYSYVTPLMIGAFAIYAQVPYAPWYPLPVWVTVWLSTTSTISVTATEWSLVTSALYFETQTSTNAFGAIGKATVSQEIVIEISFPNTQIYTHTDGSTYVLPTVNPPWP